MLAVRKVFTVSNAAWVLALAYLTFVGLRMWAVSDPLSDVIAHPSSPAAIEPLWPPGTRVRVQSFLSMSKKQVPREVEGEHRLVFSAVTETGPGGGGEEVHVTLVPVGGAAGAGAPEGAVALPQEVWRRLTAGRQVYLHCIIAREDSGATESAPYGTGADVLYGLVPLVRKLPPSRAKPRRRLLCAVPALRFLVPREEIAHCEGRYVEERDRYLRLVAAPADQVPDVPKFVPEVAIRLVDESRSFDMGSAHYVAEVLHLHRRVGGGIAYETPLHVDEVGLTSDQYVPLNETVAELPLRLSVERMGVRRFRLMSVMESSLSQQKDLGFQDSDIDDVRRLVADTNVVLLAVTMVVSVLHLLFEFLAFKSDVNFWRKSKSLRGLSLRALSLDLCFQSVILLYLLDQGASLLVLVPAGAGILIQLWKVRRAASLEKAGTGELDKLSRAVDKQATNYLLLLALPAVTGMALRSLLCERHAGWYSFVIEVATAATYAGGFCTMVPQLIINQRLRTVSQLPWRFLCYRFLTTIVDDFFSFIVKMPMMHRVACFRDDVVFFIYLAQRYYFPVDLSRPVAAEDVGS